MYGKFVGLDIGTSSIKIALIQRGLRDVKLLKAVQLNSSSSPQSSQNISEEFFLENGFPKDGVATSLLSNPVSIKILKFPFSDPRKIDQVYEFELESGSPFDPRNKFHGYHLVKRAEAGEAIVCMFEKENVKYLLHICEQWGIDPKVVTYSPLASSALSGFLTREHPLVSINIGASKTTFSLFDEGGLKRIRSSSRAGNHITEYLSRELEVSYEEAESIKHEGFRGVDRDKFLEDALSPVVDEIKKTIQFFELEIKDRIKTVLISGGTSLMPGIGDHLAIEINRNVKRLFIPDLGGDRSPVFSDSFALALYGSALRNGDFNLRKGEFKYVGKNEEIRKTFMLPAVLISLLLLLSFYSYASGHFELKNNIKDMEAQIEREVRKTFPNIKVIPKPVAFMENEVKKVTDELELFRGIRGGSTPLDILRNISVGIPQSIGVTVEEINFVDDRTLRMGGKCNSYEEVAEIEKALSNTQTFERVVIDSTDTAVNNSIRFQMTLVLK